MTMSSDRLAQLRTRIADADIEPAENLDEIVQRGIAHAQQKAGLSSRIAQLDVRLSGAAVREHDVSVRVLAGVLGPLQESLTAVGQALRQNPTGRGRVPTAIVDATELSISPQLTAGSIVLHLSGPAEATTGDELPEATGTESLVDASLRAVFSVLAESQDDVATSGLSGELRRLGPRTAKHLNDLAQRVLDDDVQVGLVWRLGTTSQRASLDRRSALALHDAIQRNRVEVSEVVLTGRLLTVSTVRKAELDMGDAGTVKLSVDPDLALSLGDYYDRDVTVGAQQTTTWSTNTGVEKRTYALRLIGFLAQAGPATRTTKRSDALRQSGRRAP
jgi:hypothetical protein